jgi:quercetin dioxygenase-like cupin family protein
MTRKALVTIIVAVFVFVGGAQAQYGGGGIPVAEAQGAGPVPQPKGVTESNLVTSLGGFRGVTAVPVVVTGQVVTIAPGGQTGRQRHTVPSYIYVLEGDLTTNSFGGPVGVNGVQYHTAGQSYMDAPSVWHNHSNTGGAPVKYLLLFISTPGAPTITEKSGTDD